ncbi:MAG: hypothetical protein ABIT16_00125 [Croceibacterium sp.]
MRFSGLSLFAGLVGALIASTPALAQDASVADAASAEDGAEPAADGNIVVTGKIDTPPSGREITRQARSITTQTALQHLPLPRFEDRLCPGVFGLKAEYASMMIDRLRDNAEHLDLWLSADDGTCHPNFIVAFVDDGQAELSRIEANQGWLFQSLSIADRREMLEETGPVRVWTTTQQRTRDGMPIARRENLTDPPVVSMWMAHSKIYLPIREDITQVIVLFDKNAVRNMTLVQLADYATMRGLARTRPTEDGQALDSILSLFDPDGSPPLELTNFDHAYLAAVYDSIPNIPGMTKVLGVNRQLRRQAEAAEREAAATPRE